MIQAIRGMHDVLPADIGTWQRVEQCAYRVFARYGYQEIRIPLLEKTELFTQTLGAATDVVEKEMYTFDDRNGESLSLRPEGTAGVVRAVLQHSLLHTLPQRLWYCGPMFRYEKPQQGRSRQFHQIGAEVFGAPGPDVDLELLLLSARLWRELGILDQVELQLNTLGSAEERHTYREQLRQWLEARRDQLDDDSQRRIASNPLRVLDSKVPATREVIANAPQLEEFLQPASREHYQRIGDGLNDAGVSWSHQPHLVRGLDYYSHMVFEWVTDRLGAQGTICAGGRYDGLCAVHGGPDTPAVGFAMGIERVVALVDQCQPATPASPHAYLVMAGEAAQRYGQVLAERLRDALPELRLQSHIGGGGFKAQFKRADRCGAELALVIGDDEAASAQVTVKPMRGQGEQQTIAEDALVTLLARLIQTEGAAAE